MFTKTMKWVSIAVLLLAVLWRLTASSQVLLEIVVCVSGLLVVTQAVRAGKYFWAAGFVAIAVLFNPVVPGAFSRKAFLWLGSVSLLTFLVSLAVSRRQTILSMPSRTDRAAGSESL
jgi:hypothetical protein